MHDYIGRKIRCAAAVTVALFLVFPLIISPVSANTPSNPADLEVNVRGADAVPESVVTPLWPHGAIPLAPRGHPKGRSILDKWEEYDPGEDDPERDSHYRGYRIVDPLVGPELHGAEDTAEDLARSVLAAIRMNDKSVLRDLMMSREEFDSILWREFPASRPITNITVSDVWAFHLAHTRSGVNELITLHGGKELALERIDCAVGLDPYTNFNLLRGIRIHAVTEKGEKVVINQARTFVERNGRWKVYIYHD